MLISSLFSLIVIGIFIGYRIVECVENYQAVIVVGNFTLNGQRYNIAEFDLKSSTWSTKFGAQLFVYGENNGVIWDAAVNTSQQSLDVYAVGFFDTVTQSSQVQLCSVASFDGISFDKIGEGLCSRGGDSGAIVIKSVIIGNGNDLFVGGQFATRVWDGHHFVYVYHVALFDAKNSAWLPLTDGGELKCSDNADAR